MARPKNIQGVTLQVTGLKELNAAFRAVDTNLNKEIRVAFLAVAKYVVGVAQQRMPFRSGEAAKSLRPRATQKGAGIARPAGGRPWQGEKADYYPWLDFGGTTGRGHSGFGHNTFGGAIKRPVVKGGRYLYPAISESKAYTLKAAEDAVDKAARSAGFDTKGGL